MTYVGYKVGDNAIGNLNTSLTAVATTLTLKSGDGANFPEVVSGTDFAIGTLTQFDGNGFEESNVVQRERVTVTEHVAGTDTFTITRSYGGDTALAFDEDDYFSFNVLAIHISELQDELQNKLDITDYQNGNKIAASSSIGTDSYAITLDPAPTSYSTTQTFRFLADVANTGPATLNVNSLGAVTIKKKHDLDLEDGDIEAGQIVTVSYDGTNFQMDSQVATLPVIDIDGMSEDTTGDMEADYIAKDGGSGNEKILVSKYRATNAEAWATTATKKFLNPYQVGQLGIEVVAGTDKTAGSDAASHSTTSATYTKTIQFTMNRRGTYTVEFDLSCTDGNSGTDVAYARIYKNGVAEGTERSVLESDGTVSYSEDISVEEGDTIEIHQKFDDNSTGGTRGSYVTNFAIKYNAELTNITPTQDV